MVKIHVQRVPKPDMPAMSDSQMSIYRRRPTPEFMKQYTVDEQMDVLEMMQESLVYGLAKALDLNMPLQLKDTYPGCYTPAPGRCNWTWDTVRQCKGDEPFDTSILQSSYVRPSHRMPLHLRRVSPRFAWMLTGMKLTELQRCMATMQDEVGEDVPSSYNTLSRMMAAIPYEARIRDGDRQRHYLHQEPVAVPKNARRNAVQEWAMQIPHISRGKPVANKPSKEPLAAVIAKNPPYAADLNAWVTSLFKEGLAKAEGYLHKMDDLEERDGLPDTDKLREKLQEEYVQQNAAWRFVHSAWHYFTEDLKDSSLPYHRRASSLLAYSMAVEVAHRRHRLYLTSWKATDLLALSRLTGLSPAVFINWAIDHRVRCGYCPIPEGTVHLLADIVARIYIPDSRPAAQGNREDLVQELRDLADKVADVALTDERTQRMLDLGDLPEWGVQAEEADIDVGW